MKKCKTLPPRPTADVDIKQRVDLARQNVAALKAQKLARYKLGLLTAPVRESLLPK